MSQPILCGSGSSIGLGKIPKIRQLCDKNLTNSDYQPIPVIVSNSKDRSSKQSNLRTRYHVKSNCVIINKNTTNWSNSSISLPNLFDSNSSSLISKLDI